jgi:hypothetical protein
MQTGTVNEEATEELQGKEYHELSEEDDVFFDASEREAPIKNNTPPPTMQKTVESARERSNWGTAWMQVFNTRQTQSLVTQEKTGPASKIFQWKLAQTQASAPQPPAPPTTSENGQLIRKTKVSREALQSMQIEFSEEGNYVRLPKRIGAETLQILRTMSQDLCKNSNLWWTDPPSRPAVISRDQKTLSPQVVSSSRVAPPGNWQNDRGRQIQTLRKTIVSRSALQQMGMFYSEDADYVFLSQKLDAATVQRLRDLSTNLSGNPREWWT